MAVFSAWAASEKLLRELQRPHPMETAVDVLLLLCFAFAAAGLVAFMLWILIHTFRSLFPIQITVTVEPTLLSVREQAGPFRRARVTPAQSITYLLITPPPTTLPERQRAVITLRSGGDRAPLTVFGEHPHDLAIQAANAILGGMSRIVRDSRDVTVIDTMQPGFLDADEDTPPENLRFEIQQSNDRVKIFSPPVKLTPRTLLGSPLFRMGLWTIGTVVIADLLFPLLPLPPDELRFVQSAMAKLVFGYGAIGAVFCATALLMLNVWQSVEATSDGVELSGRGLLSRRSRRWSSAAISWIGVAYRRSENRYLPFVQIIEKSGKRASILAGDVLALRYAATLLRKRCLNAGQAARPAHTNNPTDSSWHGEDEADTPEECP